MLESVDALLQKSGARFFDAVSGQPYHPQSGAFAGFDYRLTAPDGTRYSIDTVQGIKQIDTPAGAKLFVSENGITADSGATLQFIRDAAGRISRVFAPDGSTLIYQYDALGQLTVMRNLSTGEGFRYAYEGGRLVTMVAIGEPGVAIDYAADGTVSERVVQADLGGAAVFNGEPVTGTLAAGAAHTYSFSVRASEITGTAGGQLILRVATSGGATPAVRGLTPLSLLRSGDNTVALYGIRAEGLYQLVVEGGGGAYNLQLGIAGDLNRDGLVDGLDSAAIGAAGAGTDLTGDGITDRSDRQVLYANYGFAENAGPRLAATLPTVFTHEDLGTVIDLSKVATDPDGDDVYFRIVGVEHGSAQFSADGRYLLYRPHAGFTGASTLQLVADDGFSASPTATLAVTVSDAPLLGIDFVQRRLLGDVGDNFLVVLEGDFADQQDVVLTLDYVNLALLDPSIASLSPQGLLTMTKDGATALVASRGAITAATVVGVGQPTDPAGLLTLYYGIDAYPDTVTLLPEGGTRQTIVKRGSSGNIFVSQAADGTLYFSGNTGIAGVGVDGLITAAQAGETTITVINGFAEDRVRVNVAPPLSTTGMAVVGAQGGIVASPDGIVMAIGAGQLQGDATVTLSTVSEAALSLPTPHAPDGTETFKYLAAFDFDVQGGELLGPVQVAIPVVGDFTPGETVYFFQRMRLPFGPTGEEREVWAVVDSGTIGADGLARTASPPFPGLSNRGSVLIARAAQPIGIVTLDVGFLTGIAVASSMALGMAAASGSLLGATVFGGIAAGIASLAALAFLGQKLEIHLWRQWGQNKQGYKLDVQIPPGGTAITIVPSLPTPPVDPAELTLPRITELEALQVVPGDVKLLVKADNVVVAGSGFGVGDVRIGFRSPGQIVYADASAVAPSAVGPTGGSFIVSVPADVLLGLVDIVVERPTVDPGTGQQSWVRSGGTARVDNKAGYGFVGRGNQVYVIDTARPDEPFAAKPPVNLNVPPEDRIPYTDPLTGAIIKEPWVKTIEIPGVNSIKDTLATNDLSRVFVAHSGGVSVIDAFTLQLVDVPDGGKVIPIPGGVTALTIDPSGRYLYAAGVGRIVVIDLLPGAANFHRVAQEISVLSPNLGLISDLAVTADGKRLFAIAPHTTLFGAPGVPGWTQGGREQGYLHAINVDEKDRPDPNEANAKKWREVINANERIGLDPYRITATSAADKLLVTSRMDLNNGLRTVVIKNNAVAGFDVDVSQISLKLNKAEPGIRILSGDQWYPTVTINTGNRIDVNVRNATGVAVSSDLQYAFVGDWYVPRMYYFGGDYTTAFLIEEKAAVGSKVGIVFDPFKLGIFDTPTGVTPGKIMASTSPIPMSFLEDVVLDASGQKLYAGFRGAGNIAVYDVDKMTARASRNDLDYAGAITWDRYGLDHPWADYAEGVPAETGSVDPNKPPNPYTNAGRPVAEHVKRINMQPIDIPTHTRGLSLQSAPVLTLLAPSGEVDTDNSGELPLKFEWEIDYDLLGGNASDIWRSRIYVSGLAPGAGLWPDDPFRDRPKEGLLSNLYDEPDLGPDEDPNPSRIVTAPIDLKIGKRYVVTATAAGGLSNPDNWVEAGDSGNQKRTIVELDHVVRKALTAGQTFHWGVDLVKKTSGFAASLFGASYESQNIFGSATFESAPVTATTPYSTVTVLTHGFQLGLLASFFDNGQFAQPPAFMDMAQLIVEAGGGGVVLRYDKLTGDWVDRDTGLYGHGGAVRAGGKPVVLVSDWYVESDISDTGFSEAAADALLRLPGRSATSRHGQRRTSFALTAALHRPQPRHGGEQRDHPAPRLPQGGRASIHMTTLDPHDFDQKSLDIPIGDAARATSRAWSRRSRPARSSSAAPLVLRQLAGDPVLYRGHDG